MLNLTYSCVTKTSYVALAINILLNIYLGIQMPNSRSSKWLNWLLCGCYNQQRSAHEPPFFFQEVRIGILVVSILFNLGRLIYEATVQDISVILVAARLCLTTVQLVDQWWFCKNWESFFIEKKMRAYIWFRLFVAVCMFGMIYCVLKTFPPYTSESRLIQLDIDAFLWTAGLQVMIWYLWGKRWDFNWGDMNDERRIPAIVGAMFTSSLIYGMGCVYRAYRKLAIAQFGMTAAITATVAYFLLGLAFRYLNIVTIRSSQACQRILDESKVAPMADGHSHGSLPLAERENSDGKHRSSSFTSLSAPRRNSNLMMNSLRQSLNSRKHFPLDEASSTSGVADRMFGNNVDMITEENRIQNVDKDDEEKGNTDRQSVPEYVHPTSPLDGSLSHNNSSNKDRTNNSSDNIGSTSASSSIAEKGNDTGRERVKPSTISLNGNLSHTVGSNYSIALDRLNEIGNDNIGSAPDSANQAASRVRLKPIDSTAPIISPTISCSVRSSHVDNDNGGCNNSILLNRSQEIGNDNIGSPSASSKVGGDRVDSELVRDVLINVSLTRQNSLEINVVSYETAHLLSDKVAVVFAQVILTSQP